MKRIIVYMVRQYNTPSKIEQCIFEQKVTEENIQMFLANKEEELEDNHRYNYSQASSETHRFYCDLLSIVNLEE